MAFEWYIKQPNGTDIDDLRAWHQGVGAFYNPIHKVFYEMLLLTGFRKTEALTLE